MRVNFLILLFLLGDYRLINCETVLELDNEVISKPDPDFPAFESVFRAIIDTYILKDKSPLDIFILEPFPIDYLHFFDKLLARINDSLPYKLVKFNRFRKHFFSKYPAILLIPNESSFADMFIIFKMIRYYNQELKYFVFIVETSFESVRDHFLIKFHKNLTLELGVGAVFYYSYFIINEPDIVSISTLEYFLKVCNRQQLVRIHSFNKTSMKWIGNFKAYEKFFDYNGCELTMMLPVFNDFNLNSYHWGFSILDANAPNGFSVQGITPKIFKIAGEKYNFKDSYCPAMIFERDWIFKFESRETVLLIAINDTIKYPNVYFDITGAHLHSILDLRMSNVFEDVKYKLFVTPGDPYTPYEKLFLPFDLTTWILLTATFGITFLTIFIINRLPKAARNFVYGSKICTPSLNVISIFFGVSQARLPTENFSSKSFEFLTNVPRRPPPKTLNDLISQNYTIYTLFRSSFESIISNERDNWPQIIEPKFKEYISMYETQSQNSTAKICLIIEDLLQNVLDSKVITKWNKIELENIFVAHQAVVFHQKSFYFRMMMKTINSLIDTGIMKHLTDDYLKQKKFIVLEEIPMSLKLNDLSFGFNIWLGFCAMSFIVFLVELMKNLQNNKTPRLFKYAKVYPYAKLNNKQNLVPKTSRMFKIRKQKEATVSTIEDVSVDFF
ncbi:unnamed protein product [Chironomus riparius]|uniref:Ionotropic receptor n=1 Tax=Chironomus riparius TaxID=315576 RepID=A0A9N9RYY3_9DIPT|nr:unnamed protein product [Chironomus riparius]